MTWCNLAAMQWALEQDLSGPVRHLLLELSAMANGNGMCWPSVRSLGDRLGMNQRNTRKYLAQLERLGLIVRQREAGPAGVNLYALKCFTVMQGRSPATAPLGRQRPSPPVASDLPPRSLATGRREAVKTSIEEPPLAPRQRGEGRKKPRPVKDQVKAYEAAKADGYGPEMAVRYNSGRESMGEILKDLGYLAPEARSY